MRKKKLYVPMLAILTLISTGCEKTPDLYQGNKSGEDLMSNPMQELKIDVPTGKYAVVMFGGDTLAVCPESTTIMAPNTSVTTVSGSSTTSNMMPSLATRAAEASGDITIEYLVKSKQNNVLSKQKAYEIMAFEDSKNGDYDYNDLIMHVRIEKSGNNYSLCFHPIALGATKTIGLGCVLKDTKENTWDHLVFSDVRSQLFEGREGFINTEAGKELYQFTSIYKLNVTGLSGDIKSADWFIQVDGERIYAVSSNYKYSDANNKPYGLILANINTIAFKTYMSDECGYDWFDYPAEKVNIDDVYDFSNTFFNSNMTSADKYHKLGFINAKDDSKVIKATGKYTLGKYNNQARYVVDKADNSSALYSVSFNDPITVPKTAN